MNIQSSMHESNTSRSKRATKCSIPRSTPIITENILRTRHQMTLLGIICYVITVWLDATGYMILAFLMLDTKASYGHVWWRRQTLFPILTIPYIQTRKMIVFIKLLEILSLSLSRFGLHASTNENQYHLEPMRRSEKLLQLTISIRFRSQKRRPTWSRRQQKIIIIYHFMRIYYNSFGHISATNSISTKRPSLLLSGGRSSGATKKPLNCH